MARPATFHRPKTTRSDESDNYYDGRAYYPHTKAAHGRFRNTIDENAIDIDPGAGTRTKVPSDRNATAYRRDSQTASGPRVIWSARIDHEFSTREPAEQNRRIAEWLDTQQVSEHIILPLDSFESMIDQVIETEEALEKLKNIAFSCVREARPTWRRPDNPPQERPPRVNDTNYSPGREIFEPSSIDLGRSNLGIPRDDGCVSSLNELPPWPPCHNYDANEVPTPRSGRDENNEVVKSQAFTGTRGREDLTRMMEGREPSTLSDWVHGEKDNGWTAKQTSDVTSRPVILPTSWLEDSGSQSSGKSLTPQRLPESQIRVVPPSPGVIEGNERVMDDHVRPAQNFTASLRSSQNSVRKVHTATTTLKADKAGTASRVEARLRNGVDKFLLKIRPSRNSLLQDNPSSRAPLMLSPHELDAYLALPTRPAGTTKMTPRSPTGNRHERVLTSRHSAPLLRGR